MPFPVYSRNSSLSMRTGKSEGVRKEAATWTPIPVSRIRIGRAGRLLGTHRQKCIGTSQRHMKCSVETSRCPCSMRQRLFASRLGRDR